MTQVICDVVRCEHNENFICKSAKIHINLNHVNDSNGKDYTAIIECQENTVK